MPPESLPRDRKEFFRERKNERSWSEGGGGGSSNRWRDIRRPGGYGKGFPMLSEESFRGSGPSRSNDKILDDESSRLFGKYGRSSRENRGGPFSQRGWKGHSSDAAATSSLNGTARMQSNVNDKSCNQIDLKDPHDKNGGVSDTCTGQKLEGENSLGSIDWKTLKWTRSGSMSSRGSDLSHSSSSKSIGVDSTETKVDVHPQNVSPLDSPSCAVAGASFAAPTEETDSRKKPRLGWGEGLAKFEKKKVDIPCDTAVKNGVVLSESCTEHARSHVLNIPDRSPRLAGLLSCTSPATPSSVACSSSPGVEDKSLGKAANVETAKLCGSPSQSQNQYEDLSCNLVTLEETPVANICSSLGEMLQCNDQGSMDSDFVKSTVMNKLLVLKADVSKKIEATESEIDSLENELKLLISDIGSVHPHPASSSSLPVVCLSKPSEEVGTASNLLPRPDPLQTSGNIMKDKNYGASEGELAEGKDEDIDSPGTATSKFSEPMYLGKPISFVDIPNPVESSWNVDASRNDNAVKSSVYAVNEEGTDTRPSENIYSNCHMLSNNVGVQAENIYDLIVTSNKESSHRASEVFSKLAPTNVPCFRIPTVDNIPCLKVDPLVKEKFAMRKRFMKFKERVITLKFRVFQHLWKEDLRLLSIKRSRAKPQKKFELGPRMLSNGYQKHRASIRSRFSSPAGNLSLVPTTQVINFASKLLAESHTKIYRSTLNMPSLILDNKEKIMSKFISSNGFVEDPCSAEKERCMINPWTSEEKEIFLDKLSIFGKDFRKIASFLDHKTTADCVEFYYKNHKSDCFQKTKKKPEYEKRGKSYSKNTYLVTSGKRWNRDNNAASLDLLGAASAIAANDDDVLKNQKCAPKLIFGSCNSRPAHGDDVMLKRPSAINILGNERENVAADVLAGICGSLSSEAISSCITSSIDIGEGYQERKCRPVGLKKKRSVTPEVAQDVDEGTCSDESCGEVDPTDWTDEEKSIFLQAVSSYGKDFAMISERVRTKSSNQCKVFYSKARKCLGLDMMHPGSCGGGASLSDDTNGGGGPDTEDASLVETGSGVKSGSKTDDELSLSSSKPNQDETYPSGIISIHPDTDRSKKINSTGESDVIVDELGRDDVAAESEKKSAHLVFDGDNNFGNSVGRESLAVEVLKNGFGSDTKTRHNETAESCSREKPAVGPEVGDIVKPSSTTAESGGYVDSSRPAEAGSEFSLPGNSFNERGLGSMPQSAGNASLSAGTDLSATGALPGCELRNPIKVDAAPFSVLQNPVIQDHVVVQSEKSLDLTSKLVSGKTSNPQLKISVSADVDYPKHLYQLSSIDDINPSKSLQAFPLSIPTKKELNGDICCNKPTSSISKVDRNFYSEHLLPQDSCLRECNGPKHNDTRSELHLLSQDHLKENPRRPRPRCLSDSDQATRKGDVKLFGQILSHPSNQQKPNSRAEEKEDRDAKHAKLCENPFNLKITPSQNLNGILASTKFDHNSYPGLRNHPVRSFGFWDGNRIQTGFPSLPDSAILLAKYPAAFGHYSPSSSKAEQQQQLHRISECNLNGASVMPARELGSSKGVADYQSYRNCDGAKLQQFTVDLKQQQNRYFSEMQRRGSEFDGVSSVQQHARGMVGLDVLGRGGILLDGGGPRNTVSDPVAAIRRHYAGEQYNGQIGSILRKEETWRSNGNVGR